MNNAKECGDETAKTILVVGGQGAVGQAAVTQLSQRGYRVITAGRREHPNHPHHIVFDLFDHKALADSCRQVDLVLNAAGPASDIEAHIALTALAEGNIMWMWPVILLSNKHY